MIDIIQPLIQDIEAIGDKVYEKYRTDVKITTKDDESPVTNVDIMVHQEMSESLATYFPDIPIISEEGHIPDEEKRKALDSFFLLDPLDGTLDFINETDEFVISLGLIQNLQPVMGILHHPVSGKTWVGIKDRGVFQKTSGTDLIPIQPYKNRDYYVILVSAYRNDDDLCSIIVRQREKELGKEVRIKPVGSALKFGYLADGIGDEYLRFTPMKEWDFSAGHCIAIELGAQILPLDPNQSIEYGSRDMLIPPISIRKPIKSAV